MMNTSGQRGQQRGFIQGAILVGLALLVLVVAGFSLANRDAAATTGKEQARLNASVMMKQAVDLKDAIYRAVSDNVSPADMNALRTAGYITEVPTAPTDSGITPLYGGASGTIYSGNINGLGTSANDTYIIASPVSQAVCDRINAALYSTLIVPPNTDANVNTTTGVLTLTNAPWPGRSEGCVPNAIGALNANVYFKVVVVR